MRTSNAKPVCESLIYRVVRADYTDVCSCAVPQGWDASPDDLAVDFWTVAPWWVDVLLRLRNVLVKPFGLKGGGLDAAVWERAIREGGSVGIMSVAAKSPVETVIKLSDSHLDAWMSVLFDGGRIHALTAVKYNNCLGRAYFAVIRPFHKVVVRSMLRGSVCRLSRAEKRNPPTHAG